MKSFSELYNRLLETLNSWLTDGVAWAPRLLVALVVLGIFWMLGKGVRRGVTKALARTKMSASASDLLARAAHFIVILAGLMATLSVLQLDEAVTGVLAGAGVVGLALGFAFQDLASNLISGVGLSVRHPFRQGDIIESNGVLGVAESIELRVTVIRTLDGKRVMVPNKKIFQDVLINHSTSGTRRVEVACGVSYDTDLDMAKATALEALGQLECLIDGREPEVFFGEFGDSSINFDARVWIAYESQLDYLRAKDELVRALKKAFDAKGIDIPFPIRTLELGESASATITQLRKLESLGGDDDTSQEAA